MRKRDAGCICGRSVSEGSEEERKKEEEEEAKFNISLGGSTQNHNKICEYFHYVTHNHHNLSPLTNARMSCEGQ